MSKKYNAATTGKKRSLRMALSLAAGIALLSIPVWVNSITGTTEPKSATAKPTTKSLQKVDLSRWDKELCCDYSAQLVDSPTDTDKQAIKFTLKQGDPIVASSKRAELRTNTIPAGSERWYSFRIFLPENYQQDTAMEILSQWHNSPDTHLGENWRTPSMHLKTDNGRWMIHRRWDPNPVTKNNRPGPGGGMESVDLGAYKTGVWTNWVVHAKWSYKSDGLLEIWRDGKLVARKTGPNTYNDKRGPFFKIGIYKPQWKSRPERSQTDTRVVYFDQVRVGKTSDSYQDLGP